MPATIPVALRRAERQTTGLWLWSMHRAELSLASRSIQTTGRFVQRGGIWVRCSERKPRSFSPAGRNAQPKFLAGRLGNWGKGQGVTTQQEAHLLRIKADFDKIG